MRRPGLRAAWLALATAAVGWGLAASPASAASNLSAWVYPGPSGWLIHQPDALGNRIADSSGVGYMGGSAPLPVVPTVLTISPVPGDNGANIQNALDTIAAMTPDSNGFRGALLLTAGYYPIADSVSINASGIVLRGVGNSTNGAVLYSTSTNGPSNGQNQLQGLVIISGSYSPAPVGGTSNNIIDNYVPVGARSFTVDGAGVLNVGDHVIVHRPSTANWIHAIGMDQLNAPWQPGTVDVDAERIISRIEGNRIMIDEPLTTALEQQYGGGSVYAYTWPQRYNKIGIENLRGESYYNHSNTNDEDHAWIFIRFSNTEDFWVRDVVSQYFGKSCVSCQTGTKHGTVLNCQCLDPISIILSERRYAFDLNSCALTLVQNCYTRQDRHQFITQSLTDGPDVFVDGLSEQAYDLAGPHVRWASGVLFDNITTDNGMTVANQGNSGASGHGWCGANCVVWDSSASFFTVEGPPTANNWLIGSLGPLAPGGGGNAGPHGPGTYDSLGTNVFPNSLYYAQLQDRIAAPNLQVREYRLGGVDSFSASHAVPLDTTWSNAVKTAAAGLPLDNFGVVASGHWVPFTFNFALSPNERIVSATLSLSMLAAAAGDTNDVLYLDSLTNSFLFSALGWLPLSIAATNPTVKILDLWGQLALLADGKLNVAVQNDVALDWAVLELKVAPILTTFTNALPPAADATVRAGVYATNNFGDTAMLAANEATLADNEQKSYLRWDLNGVTGTILQARVRLVPISVASGGIEQGVTFATTNVWDESSITWSNQPGGGKRFATWIPTQNVPVEFVVPPQMMDTVAAQNNQLCLQLFSIHNVGVLGAVNYASREHPDPSLRPQLFLVISNSAPGISGLTNIAIFQDTSAGPIPFFVGDSESSGDNLALSAFSSNPALLPTQGIVFGGSGQNPTLTLTPAAGQTGSAAISIIVTDPGGLTATNQFTLTVAAYTNAAFVIGATPPSQAVAAGAGTSYSVNLTATNGPFTSNVVLSVSGLPFGATAGLTPSSINGSGTATLTVTTATNTPGGTCVLTITGVGGGLTRSTTVMLVVSGFSFSATPASQNVSSNGSTSFTVGVGYTNGFNGAVSFSVNGLPAGAAAGFSPTSVSGSGSSILTVTASPAMPPGIYPLTITATSGALAQSVAVSLNVFAFSVSAVPSAQAVTTSASVNYTATISGTPGISNVVALSVSGLPAGAVAGFLPATLVGSGETTLSVGTALNTPPGVYPLTVTGVSGSLTNSTTVTMIVTDFGISAAPLTQTVVAGNSTNFTTTITAINGFADEVDFTVTGLPAEATASFTPGSVTGSGAATMSVATTTNTPAGTYVLTVTGTDGTLTHSTNVTLKVAGFLLGSSPNSRTVTAGGGSSFTATVTFTNGFSGSVALTVSGLPAGVTAGFSPASLSASGTSTLTVTSSLNTVAADYDLTITATSGNIALTSIATFKVRDFSIAAAPPSQSVNASVGTSYTINVTTNNSFTGNVVLSVTGLPAGATAAFTPATVTNTGVSTLSITTSNATPGGAYILTITGTSGALSRSTNVTLNITALAAGFVVNATPATQTVPPGGGSNYVVSVNAANGFAGSVALSVAGLPAGANAVFNPPTITNSGNSTLAIATTSNTTPTGIYNLVLQGVSGTLTNSATNTLRVFDFTMAASPSSRTVLPGQSDTFTATVAGTAGISNVNVALSVSGLPTNSSASFSPAALSSSGTSTLTVTTSNNTPAGNYTLTLNGAFGGLVRPANTVTLRVRDFTIASSSTNLTLAPGLATNASVTIGALNAFTGVVFLNAGGLPAGASASFNPPSVANSGSSTMTITNSAATVPGTYIVTISGNSGTLTRSTNLTFVVAGSSALPSLSFLGFTNALPTLRVAGPTGPDYVVQISSKLTLWTGVFTNHAPTPPFNWTDTGASNAPVRFYRVRLGP